nr:ribonuclease H-like domain-containing protein [Tanacetum cinerariifolium]
VCPIVNALAGRLLGTYDLRVATPRALVHAGNKTSGDARCVLIKVNGWFWRLKMCTHGDLGFHTEREFDIMVNLLECSYERDPTLKKHNKLLKLICFKIVGYPNGFKKRDVNGQSAGNSTTNSDVPARIGSSGGLTHTLTINQYKRLVSLLSISGGNQRMLRSQKCVFIGYAFDEKGYKLFNLENKTILFSSDVKFYETVFPFKNKFLTTDEFVYEESGVNSLNFYDEVIKKILKSKEPKDEVGNKNNYSNIDTSVNLESTSDKRVKNKHVQVDKDMADFVSANASNNEGSRDYISNIDTTATLGSPNKANIMENVKNVEINDIYSDYEGEDFQCLKNVFESPNLDTQTNLESDNIGVKTYARMSSRKTKLSTKLDKDTNQLPPLPIASTEAPQMVSSEKLPILKKGEYILWTMKMDQYLAHTDYALWKVILSGNIAVQMTKDKADEHLARFHGIKDAKTSWAAIKTKFGGNADSKKMQKNVLKQQFEIFSVSNSEGLDKGYDRFQRLLSLLKIHEAGHSSQAQGSSSYADELMFSFFANQSSSPQLDNEDLEQIDQDDLEEMDHKWQVAMLSMRVKRFYNKIGRKLEFNGKEQVGFDKTKVECFNCHRREHFARDCRSARNSGNKSRDAGNTGYKGRNNGKRHAEEEDENALVVQDGLGIYNWSYQIEEEATDFALMAFTLNHSSSSSSNSEVQSCSKQCVQSYE